MPALIREFEPGDEEVFRKLNEEWKLLPALRLYESFGFTPVGAAAAPPSPYTRSNLRMELPLGGP